MRATEGISPAGAGIRSPCQYEYGVNDGPRILVVDDDEDIRLLLRELLGRAGYRVDEAADGRTALRQLYENRPQEANAVVPPDGSRNGPRNSVSDLK